MWNCEVKRNIIYLANILQLSLFYLQLRKNLKSFFFTVYVSESVGKCINNKHKSFTSNDEQSFNLFRCFKHTVQSLKLSLTCLTYFADNSVLYFDLISPWSGFHVRHNFCQILWLIYWLWQMSFVRRYAVMLQFCLLYFCNDIAGDYFQALRNITAPAASMVRQQSSLIITPEWEYSS